MLKLLTACVAVLMVALPLSAGRSFYIENDRFVIDGEPVQLVAGCIHYFRIPRPYWQDRLLKLKAMGLNSIEMYVAWNFHEREPGKYYFDDEADVEAFIRTAAALDMLVLLRPGPYICAEWNFGGLPWWLASSATKGGRTMQLRSDDADYIGYVERWWTVLFQRIKPLLFNNGGPVVMVQIENEYGYCSGSWGPERAQKYLRQLVAIARRELGDEVVLYTTDPPNQVEQGTLRGDEVFTAVDFGPGWYQLDQAFGTQAQYNPPGKSPPICTEFYTGWLTHWKENMANTSADSLVDWYTKILSYRNNSGSVSFYMAHGGTNFGFWGGANVGDTYQPHTTSYDYDCPVSEAGGYGQPGIGGDNKYQLLRDAFQKLYPDKKLPEVPAASKVASYGTVQLELWPTLLAAVQAFVPSPFKVDTPDIMEEYGQGYGLTLYRTLVPISAFQRPAVLKLAVHDYAKVFLNGHLAGGISRNELGSTTDNELQEVTLPMMTPEQVAAGSNDEMVVLDILVEAVGRSNFGCDWDLKGIINPMVLLNDTPLKGWLVYPLELDSISPANTPSMPPPLQLPHVRVNMTGPQPPLHSGPSLTSQRSSSQPPLFGFHGPVGGNGDKPGTRQSNPLLQGGPQFLVGSFIVPEGMSSADKGNAGFPADTFLDTPGFTKGLAWVNGFNLGWYWPEVGPQMRLYIPGADGCSGDQQGSNSWL